MIEVFNRAMKRLELTPTETQLKQMDLFISELKIFNPVYKLVKYEDEHELVVRHFLDCLTPLSLIKAELKENDTVADLGSGAGFPGILLAIMLPEHQVYLIERMKRRTDFLTNVIARTGLKNVTIINEDLEKVEQKFNFVTCRAFHPLFDIVTLVEKVLEKDGTFCAYKGQQDYLKSELVVCKELPFNFEIIPIKVPYLDEERCLCMMKRN